MSNVSRNYLLVDTDSVSHPTTLQFRPEAAASKMFGGMRVSGRVPPCEVYTCCLLRACKVQCQVAVQLPRDGSKAVSPDVAMSALVPFMPLPVTSPLLYMAQCCLEAAAHVRMALPPPQAPLSLPQPDLVEKLGSSDYNISIENHMYGVLPEFHNKWPVLKDFFTILTTTKDRNGTEYISTIEAKKYPFFGGCLVCLPAGCQHEC